MDEAGVLMLVFPLYVDSLPAQLTYALECIAERRRGGPLRKDQRLAVVVNCGLPEPYQNDTALAICRQFAKEARFAWAGGLALGAGPALAPSPLEKQSRRAHNVMRALDLAAAALAEGQPIPEQAVSLMAKPLVPRWAYLFVGTARWHIRARTHGAWRNLAARPYERDRGA